MVRSILATLSVLALCLAVAACEDNTSGPPATNPDPGGTEGATGEAGETAQPGGTDGMEID